jgi:hypothetical protein
METRDHSKNGASLKSLTSKGNLKLFALFVLIMTSPFVFSSCLTIFTGTKQRILVTGNVSTPVELFVDGRTYSNVTLPKKVRIKRKNETSLIAAFTPNYDVEKQKLEKTFNHMVWINVLPIGIYVDWTTGVYKKSAQTKVNFNFKELQSPTEISNAYIDFGKEYYNADLLDEALFYFQQAYEADTINEAVMPNIYATYNRMDYLEERARLKAEKSARVWNIIETSAAVLSTTADVITTTQSLKSGNRSANVSDGSSGSNGGCNCSNIQTLYTKAMRKLISEKETKIRHGSDPTIASANINVSSGQNVRVYENEIQRLKREAAKCGCALY